MTARVRAATALAGAAVVLTGCGVPVDRSARTIPVGRVPFGLLSTAKPSAPADTARTPRPHLFFVRDDRIVGVPRATASTDAQTLLETLLEGPSDRETRHGLRSAISGGTRLLSLSRSGPVLRVDLSGQLVQVRGQEQLMAIAQLVFTATAAPDVSAVKFELDGQPLQVPRGDGTLTSEPVSRAQYRSMTASR